MRDLKNERTLLRHCSREIVSIFIISALAYMLGVAWYELAHEALDSVARATELTPFQIKLRFTIIVTVSTIVLAVLVHYLMRLRCVADPSSS